MRIELAVIDVTICEAWSIAAPESSELGTQLPCARDAFGLLTIPASSAVGALRDHFSSRLGPATTVQWFGGKVGESGGDGDDLGDDFELSPSRVRVLGTRILNADAAIGLDSSAIVQRTSIDPIRGAARAKSLHTIEVAPSGLTFRMFIRADSKSDDSDDKKILDDQFWDTVRDWSPFIGRGRTTGMGRAEVTAARVGVLDLDEADDLRVWITTPGEELFDHVATQLIELVDRASTTNGMSQILDVRFQADDAIFIGGGRKSGNKSWPYKRTNGTDSGKQFIEGSSLKGLLRSRTGFILRTAGINCCTEHTGCGLIECPVCWMFGSTNSRGHLIVNSTELEGGNPVSRDHVSLDRFAGGALASRLFTEEDLRIGAIFGLSVCWDRRGCTTVPKWVSAVLAWVALDIHDGFVGVGGRVTRGLGRASIIDGGQLIADLQAMARCNLAESVSTWRDSGQTVEPADA